MTPEQIVEHIRAHPKCIVSLYGKEDHELIDESVLLNPADWNDTSEPGDDEEYWENWSDKIAWGDGIRCCFEDGNVSFEEV